MKMIQDPHHENDYADLKTQKSRQIIGYYAGYPPGLSDGQAKDLRSKNSLWIEE